MKVSSEGGRISSAGQKSNLGRLEGCIFCTCIHYTHFLPRCILSGAGPLVLIGQKSCSCDFYCHVENVLYLWFRVCLVSTRFLQGVV